MKRQNNAVRVVIAIAAVIFINSCSEGLFNFTEETGNISINFTVDSSSGKTLQNVVYNLSNEQTGDSIRKECYFWTDSYGQSSECYISRADAGTWKLNIIAYDDAGNIAAESDERFDVELAQTVIVELEYFFDGTNGSISVNYESPAGTNLQPLIEFDSLDTLITGFHPGGTPSEDTQFISYLHCPGSGFDIYMQTLKVQVPDGGYLEYTSGSARSLTSIEVDTNNGLLGINLPGYSGKGIFSITAMDINGVETYIEDDCYFDMDPQTGLVTLISYGSSAYIEPAMYDINGAGTAGCILFYCVDVDDGKIVGGGMAPKVNMDFSGTVNIDMNGVLIGGTTVDVVLVTIDEELTQTEIDNAFTYTITDLSVANLPGWLFNNFGNRINYVGMSVIQHTF